MTKEQIGKEIKELIRSIKTHYTFVEEEDRIPLIELELITSKIRKLYEKSIVNNYLHSIDEVYMSQERSRRFHERKSFEKVEPPVTAKKPEESSPLLQTFTTTSPVPEAPKVEPIDIPVVETPKAPEVSQVQAQPAAKSASHRSFKDIKLLIGINDKFLLINNLFNRNDIEYKNAIEHLNTFHSIDECQDFLNKLATQYEWNLESYACKRLYQILEKRFK